MFLFPRWDMWSFPGGYILLGIVVLTLAGSAGGLSPNIPIPLKGPIGWVSLADFSLGKRNVPNGKPRVAWISCLKKNPRKWNNTPRPFRWMQQLFLERWPDWVPILASECAFEILGVLKLDFWMDFLWFSKKCGWSTLVVHIIWGIKPDFSGLQAGWQDSCTQMMWLIGWWIDDWWSHFCLILAQDQAQDRIYSLIYTFVCYNISKHQFPNSLLQMTFWLTFDWWHLFAKVLLRQPGESLGASKKKCRKFAIRTRKKAGTSLTHAKITSLTHIRHLHTKYGKKCHTIFFGGVFWPKINQLDMLLQCPKTCVVLGEKRTGSGSNESGEFTPETFAPMNLWKQIAGWINK